MCAVRPLLHSFRQEFRNMSNLHRSLLPHSSPGGSKSLRVGQWATTRYAHTIHLRRCLTHTQCLSPPPHSIPAVSLLQTDKVRILSVSSTQPRSDLSTVQLARPSDPHPELRRDKPQAALPAHNSPGALAYRPGQYGGSPCRGPPSRVRRCGSADTAGARHRRPQGLRALPVLVLQVHRAALFRGLPELLSRDVRTRVLPAPYHTGLNSLSHPSSSHHSCVVVWAS